MVVVSPKLVNELVKPFPKLSKLYTLLEHDREVQAYLTMANVMATKRLLYNDHGPVHARIVAGSALEMYRILVEEFEAVEPTIVRDGVGDVEDSKLAVLVGAYLHDIGNSVHRIDHFIHGEILADSILRRLLPEVYGNDPKWYMIKQEILHIIYSHNEEVPCLSVEAGIVKVADGTDMAEGRARVPYRHGKIDIHAVSALSIKRVEIEEGTRERPVRIIVDMSNEAGVFQVQVVLGKKIATSGLADKIQVEMLLNGRLWKVWKPGD